MGLELTRRKKNLRIREKKKKLSNYINKLSSGSLKLIICEKIKEKTKKSSYTVD